MYVTDVVNVELSHDDMHEAFADWLIKHGHVSTSETKHTWFELEMRDCHPVVTMHIEQDTASEKAGERE